jgi:hypothetical protein
MKRSSPIVAALLMGFWSAAAAQPPALPSMPRADAAGTIGWLNLNKSSVESYDDWYNRGVYGGLGVGWYWTENLKSEVEFGASAKAEVYRTRQILVAGVPEFENGRYTFSTTRLSLHQQYQFFRNVWFHPHAALGVELAWERSVEEIAPVILFDRVPRQVLGGRMVGPETRLRVRPFGSIGYKAYFTPRTFFRNDLRFVVQGGLEEVLVRFGVGVDF